MPSGPYQATAHRPTVYAAATVCAGGVTGFGARGDTVALTFNNQGHQHHRDRDAQDFGVKSRQADKDLR